MSEPSIDLVDYLFRYDPESGAICWRRVRNGRRADIRHKRVDENGQWRVVLGHTLYPAAQIAWLLGHGGWPTFPIVHLNGDINDNRLTNLARGQ